MHNPNPPFTTDSSRWQALQTRNKSAHSAFVYAVLTTKIVCRPTCPSRLARRSNIVYYDTTTEALLDGFRSCKRCTPDLPDELEHDTSAATVINACRVIEAASGCIKLAELAAAVGFSTRHLHNLFSAKLGCTPAAYAAFVRRTVGEGELILTDDLLVDSPVAVEFWRCESQGRKVAGLCDSSGDPQVPPDGDNDFEFFEHPSS